MARPSSGKNVLARAMQALKTTCTAEKLRQALAVVLPLEHGFLLDQVAAVLGIAKSWTCKSRIRFIRSIEHQVTAKPQRVGSSPEKYE